MFIVFYEYETWASNETVREWKVEISEHKAKAKLKAVIEFHGPFLIKHGIAKIMEEHTLFDRP